MMMMKLIIIIIIIIIIIMNKSQETTEVYHHFSGLSFRSQFLATANLMLYTGNKIDTANGVFLRSLGHGKTKLKGPYGGVCIWSVCDRHY